jgi:hypothetical protein
VDQAEFAKDLLPGGANQAVGIILVSLSRCLPVIAALRRVNVAIQIRRHLDIPRPRDSATAVTPSRPRHAIARRASITVRPRNSTTAHRKPPAGVRMEEEAARHTVEQADIPPAAGAIAGNSRTSFPQPLGLTLTEDPSGIF